MPNSRPRPYSLAKRICLTTTLWSLTSATAALAEAPLLRVANGKPELVEPTQVTAKPATANAAQAARVPQMQAAVDDGWVARDHIDRRAPLQDPAPIGLRPTLTESSTLTESPAKAEAAPQTESPQTESPQSPTASAAAGPILEVLPAKPLNAEDSPRRQAPIALGGLTPVPLMKVPALHIAPPKTHVKAPSLAKLPDEAPQWMELGSSAPVAMAPKTIASEDSVAEAKPVAEAGPAEPAAPPAPSSTAVAQQPVDVAPVDVAPVDEEPMELVPAQTETAQSETAPPEPEQRTAALPGLQASPQRSIPVRRPNVSAESGAAAASTGLGSLLRERAGDVERPDNEDVASDADDEEAAADAYVGDLTESDSLAEDGSPMAKPVAGKPRVVVKQPIMITPSVQRLQAPMDAALRYYYARPENAAKRSSWGMLHSIMVYGVDTQIISGRRRFNAIAWMAGNNICRGQRIFTLDGDGIAPRSGVGLQGHQGQFLAVFGLVGVPESYPLYVGKHKYSVADLVRHEQDNCRSGVELTFTLIGLSHYVDTDAEWTSNDGQRWDFERVLQEELAQPVIGAACGGTHRLMGLSHALRARREQGRPMTGQWARAEQFVNDFTDYAWKLQNPDGSMSTDWFEGRANRNDDDRKVQTTGHIVEWLIGITPDEKLQDPRMVRAISYLTNALYSKRTNDWAIGPKGHALRSLALYQERLFGSPPSWRPTAVAGQQSNSHRQHRSR